MRASARHVLLASAGFAAAMALFAYIDVTNYAPLNSVLLVLALTLCPAAIPSPLLLFDLNPHSVEMTVAWIFIGLVNSGVYVGVGAAVRTALKRKKRTVIA